MASKSKSVNTVVQDYPRINDLESKYNTFLDDKKLSQHTQKLLIEQLPDIILKAIGHANSKSRREMLSSIPSDAGDQDKYYRKIGTELFKYFRQYSSDPASTAWQLKGQDCREIAQQQFKNKTLQKERMNSGWRYQYLAIDCAKQTGKFNTISDLGLIEADFNATIDIPDTNKQLNIYVSVKNRSNTIGGPDWPGAIQALEKYANTDKNRRGPYICVFAFVMERGQRTVKRTKDKVLRSPNTELWASDYFWPFFTNFSYEEVMQAVLQVLIATPGIEQPLPEIPKRVIETFAEQCKEYGLVDESGIFNDPAKLVTFFCNPKQNRLEMPNDDYKLKSKRSKK